MIYKKKRIVYTNIHTLISEIIITIINNNKKQNYHYYSYIQTNKQYSMSSFIYIHTFIQIYTLIHNLFQSKQHIYTER